MSWCPPGEEADESVLEYKDDADSRVETAEIVGHQRQAESRPGHFDVWVWTRIHAGAR